MISEEAYNETFNLIKGACHNLASLIYASESKKMTENQDKKRLFLPLYGPYRYLSISHHKKNMLNNLSLLKEALNKLDNMAIEYTDKQDSKTKHY